MSVEFSSKVALRFLSWLQRLFWGKVVIWKVTSRLRDLLAM